MERSKKLEEMKAGAGREAGGIVLGVGDVAMAVTGVEGTAWFEAGAYTRPLFSST
jgi:hypothetical protein